MGDEFTHILDSLGWAVLHSIWQGGLAFLFVVIWRAGLSGRSPALRHAGQILALLGCMIAFMWTFAIYLGVPNLAAATGGATPLAANASEAPRLLAGLIAPLDPAAAKAGLGLSRITPTLACLWALGFAVMSLRYAFAFGQVQHLRTLGLQLPDTEWAQRFSDLAEQIDVSSRVRLFVSANVAGPMTLGLIRPIVLVPIGFLTGLPADQVEAILRHELAHIRRYDYALNLVQTAVKTVLFYHPAIHIICRWADRDREQACDDLAVRQGRDPLTLARGLAALRLQSQPGLGLAATGSGKDMPLMDRLTRLAGQKPKRGRPEHILMSILSALLLGSVYLGSSVRAEAHPHPPNLPDTVISLKGAPTATPTLPVAPEPPVYKILDISDLSDAQAIRRLIEEDEDVYKAFQKDMEIYAGNLESFFENSFNLEDQDEFEDFVEDLSDVFEDRMEDFGDYIEDQIERNLDGLEEKIELNAERIALDMALQSLQAAEGKIKNDQGSKIKGIQQKAFAEARREILESQANLSRAESAIQRKLASQKTAQAQKAKIFARQKANHKKAAKLSEIAKEHAKQAKTHAKTHAKIDRNTRNIHEQFRDIVMQELLNDGLIKSKNQSVIITHPNNVMSLNGKPVKESLRGKYCDLLDSHGFSDNKFEITIKPESLSILTDWKNGRHTTQVTYSTNKF